MSWTWPLAIAVAPLYVALLSYFVTRPASRWVERRMRPSWFKRFLLLHRDRDKVPYAIASITIVVLTYAGLGVTSYVMAH